jgi:hypothetical protein
MNGISWTKKTFPIPLRACVRKIHAQDRRGEFRVVYSYAFGTSTSCYEDGTARREPRVDHCTMIQTGHRRFALTGGPDYICENVIYLLSQLTLYV